MPTIAHHLLSYDWDLLVILESTAQLSDSLTRLVDASYTVDVALPSALPADFRVRNSQMLRVEQMPPNLNLGNPLRSLSSQRLELTPSLLALANSDICPKGPVSMLNYVSYQPWPHAAESYKKYVDGNKVGPMARLGARVKFIGSVSKNHATERGEWDECVLAQYPSLRHFCDMACDPEYQELNYKYRLPVLRDTCILLTTEVDLAWTIDGSEKVKPESTGDDVVIEPSA